MPQYPLNGAVGAMWLVMYLDIKDPPKMITGRRVSVRCVPRSTLPSLILPYVLLLTAVTATTFA